MKWIWKAIMNRPNTQMVCLLNENHNELEWEWKIEIKICHLLKLQNQNRNEVFYGGKMENPKSGRLIPILKLRRTPWFRFQFQPLFCEVNTVNNLNFKFRFLNPTSKHTIKNLNHESQLFKINKSKTKKNKRTGCTNTYSC